MRDNETVALKYMWNKYAKSPIMQPTSCKADCRRALYCDIVTTNYFNNNLCLGRAEYDWIHDPLNGLINWLTAIWTIQDWTLEDY